MIDLTGDESRYSRQELITWWDQSRLSAARVLVVGAGALGNELVKNLVLLGVGHVAVIDLDTIERSNLARGVLFREADEGAPKAEVVAAAAGLLNPHVSVKGIVGDVRRLGLGYIATFDLVVGGLDNREARAFVNAACRKLSMYWVDGAIEGLHGVARTFEPSGACYECTLSEIDREILSKRKSCALLTTEEMVSGKVPTTVTTASIVAAIQAQEAVRILHGAPGLRGEGITFIGETLDSWRSEYTEDPECAAHDTYLLLTPAKITEKTTLKEAFASIGVMVEALDAVDFEDDVVRSASCVSCGWAMELGRRAIDLSAADVICGECGEVGALDTVVSVTGDDPLLTVPVSGLGFPDRDVVTARRGSHRTHMVLEIQ